MGRHRSSRNQRLTISSALWHSRCCQKLAVFANNPELMKIKLCLLTLAAATALALRAQPAPSTMAIIESGESISATLDDAPFTHITFTPAPAINIGGLEEWIITLNDGYTWSSSFLESLPLTLGEPPGESPENRVNLIGTPLRLGGNLDDVGPFVDDVGGVDDVILLPPNSIIWASDVLLRDLIPLDTPSNILPISAGVIDPNNQPVNLLLEDLATVPESGSTLALSGVALFALGTLRLSLRKKSR